MRVVIKLEKDLESCEVALEANTSVVIGRSNLAKQSFPDDYMSSVHCRISFIASKIEIEDLKSKNGTYLNGIKIGHSDFFLGDNLKIGETTITLLQEKMDPEAIRSLTFTGDQRDRVYHVLRIDQPASKEVKRAYYTKSAKSAPVFNKEEDETQRVSFIRRSLSFLVSAIF